MALSAQEAELYDRQIRLWGVAAQQRMRTAHVLVYGLNALGSEVAKNAVLAGTNVTLGDAQAVLETDIGVNFFLAPGDVGKNRAEAALARLAELNRLVKTAAVVGPLTALPEDTLRTFAAVVICDGTVAEQLAAARLLRALSVPFMAASLFGLHAAMFSDLGPAYSFCTERRDRDSDSLITTPHVLAFPSLDEALETPWAATPRLFVRAGRQLGMLNAWLAYMRGVSADADAALLSASVAPASAAAEVRRLAAEARASPGWTHESAAALVNASALEAFLSRRGVQVVPVACILGGVIANQLVGILSGKGKPLLNVLLFDALESLAAVVVAGGRPSAAPAAAAAARAADPPAAAAIEID